MIGALTLRGASRTTRIRTIARSQAKRGSSGSRSVAKRHAIESRPRGATRRRVSFDALRAQGSFPLGARLFVLSAGVLATAFLTALLYLRFATSIAASGYDLHDLEARRDELVRQNQLLQLQIDRLDAPSRIEAEAQRLGLVKASRTLFLTAGPPVTLR
ncbi:MAG: hypothetical protein AUH85_00655 [Chloroflexi bacterium 13_1_40CM_4_68_4]|nr:MAG: hypothetical protein AUH85_00655 [Chloroflexi bacterium 13_1_40CM_4_68_4]